LLKRTGIGHRIIDAAEAIPRYQVTIEEQNIISSGEGQTGVDVELSVTCALVNPEALGKGSTKGKLKTFGDTTSILTISSDFDMVDYRRIQ